MGTGGEGAKFWMSVLADLKKPPRWAIWTRNGVIRIQRWCGSGVTHGRNSLLPSTTTLKSAP